MSFPELVDAARPFVDNGLVPGSAVGLLAGGEVQAVGVGITSLENPLDVTPDTLFQIGSISKESFRGEHLEFLREDNEVTWLRGGSRLYRREGR